jgi:hypothetical protein
MTHGHDPFEVFRELQARLEAEDYAGSLELIHANIVELLADHVRQLVENPPPTDPGPTVEGLMEEDPDMPQAVAEDQVDRFGRNGPGPCDVNGVPTSRI